MEQSTFWYLTQTKNTQTHSKARTFRCLETILVIFSTNSRKESPVNDRTAYILPKDYAYGFRGPNDKIWGLWEADSLSEPISMKLGNLLQQYDSKLDIVYQDALGLGSTQEEYKSIIYANSSALVSPTPQDGFSKQKIDGFLNPYLIAVFINYFNNFSGGCELQILP